LYIALFLLIKTPNSATTIAILHFTIDSNTPFCQDTLAPANALQAKQIKAMQLQMQLLQKESDAKLACEAEKAALKRRRDKELH
jgi:ACT domain-containing protein